jgi:hypothetical protein
MNKFSYPLTPAERRQIAVLLRSGHTCVVGDYRLYADDPDGFIEADNAYGQLCAGRASLPLNTLCDGSMTNMPTTKRTGQPSRPPSPEMHIHEVF